MYHNKLLGQYGEKLAAKFLKQKGYKIIERNFDTKFGEIDIIARDKKELVFVEVKTRSNRDFGYPELAIDDRKLWHLQRMAEVYMRNKDIKDMLIRVDAVSVEIDSVSQKTHIEHFINIVS